MLIVHVPVHVTYFFGIAYICVKTKEYRIVTSGGLYFMFACLFNRMLYPDEYLFILSMRKSMSIFLKAVRVFSFSVSSLISHNTVPAANDMTSLQGHFQAAGFDGNT